jgi:type VI secretion system protein ImpJ
MLNCKASRTLEGFIRELAGLLGQRGDALAGRLSAGGRGGVSEIGDFLLLKLVNHWLPFMLHLSELQGVHPERLYAELLRLAGELSVFSNQDRRPTRYAAYQHNNLRDCYQPLMLDLRRALSLVLEQSAIRITLEERKYGIRMAMISDKSLFKSASFVLAAHADLPADQIQAQFPAQVKIGPVEKIRDLVNLHLPGVRLKPLPIAPRELPYHAGYNYFELDSHHELWRDLERSTGLAVHVSGDFPNLDLEFWAIRR